MNDNDISIVIIDDEEDSRGIIRLLLEKCNIDYQIAGEGENVTDAISVISEKKPDIVFLDVELGGGTSFDVLEAFDKIDFEVIFITAFNHYAIKAIKFAALDYLLKPIDMKDFKEALEKAIRKRQLLSRSDFQISVLKDNINQNEPNLIALPNKDGFVFYKISDIIRCQAESNYTKFYFTKDNKEIIPKTLKEYEELLSENNFCRIHGSHLINMEHVKQYLKGKGGFVIMSDGSEIEVSVRKKDSFLKKFLKI
jgi:two-component system, LytTR family, response regulator